MAEDIGVLDGALPLIRGDNPWEQVFVFYSDDGETALDLTGKSVEAEIRWDGGKRTVTAAITDAATGEVTLSLTAAETKGLPLGRLPVMVDRQSRAPTLFVQLIDGSDETTWIRAAIDVKEGLDS